jgi:two-component system, NarL family, invasion response regulator UvrY
MMQNEIKNKSFLAQEYKVLQEVTKALKTIIAETHDLFVVGETKNGNDVLEKIQNLDVVALDFYMPGENGLDTLIGLKAISPKTPVLILSIFPENHYGTRFLKAGAVGYLGKASASDQLVEAVRKVAIGEKFLSHALADKLVADLNKDSERLPHESLRDREF